MKRYVNAYSRFKYDMWSMYAERYCVCLQKYDLFRSNLVQLVCVPIFIIIYFYFFNAGVVFDNHTQIFTG